MTPLLKWTGHPLADVGVATLCGMAERDDPTEVTLEDLDTACDEVESYYQWTDESKKLRSPLDALLRQLFHNSVYIQHQYGGRAQEIHRRTHPHRHAPQPEAVGQKCAFSGEAAWCVMTREDAPLLMGKDQINFYPGGKSGLPVSAAYYLAIQVAALGGRRSEGKFLFVHCDLPRFTLSFAREYLRDNRRLLEMAKRGMLPGKKSTSVELVREEPSEDNAGRPIFSDSKGKWSLVLHDLTSIMTEMEAGEMRHTNLSLTAYHLGSSQGPSIDMIQFPGNLVKFLTDVQTPDTSNHWRRLVQRFWPLRAVKSEKKDRKRQKSIIEKSEVLGPGKARNRLYEDLVAIFQGGFVDAKLAARFVSRYLLSSGSANRSVVRKGREVQKVLVSRHAINSVNWQLTSLFLERIMCMDKSRIDQIKAFADRLADAIHDQSDRGLLATVLYKTKRFEFQRALTSAQVRYRKKHSTLLFGLDEFVDVFIADDATGVVPWYMVRDLVSIRVIEQLDQKHRGSSGPAEYPLFDIDDSMEEFSESSDEDDPAVAE